MVVQEDDGTGAELNFEDRSILLAPLLEDSPRVSCRRLVKISNQRKWFRSGWERKALSSALAIRVEDDEPEDRQPSNEDERKGRHGLQTLGNVRKHTCGGKERDEENQSSQIQEVKYRYWPIVTHTRPFLAMDNNGLQDIPG